MVLIDTSVWLLALRRDFRPRTKERVENILVTDADKAR